MKVTCAGSRADAALDHIRRRRINWTPIEQARPRRELQVGTIGHHDPIRRGGRKTTGPAKLGKARHRTVNPKTGDLFP